jgi:hypothetical protein
MFLRGNRDSGTIKNNKCVNEAQDDLLHPTNLQIFIQPQAYGILAVPSKLRALPIAVLTISQQRSCSDCSSRLCLRNHLFHQTLADKVITDYSFQKTEFIGVSQVFQTTKKLDYERDWQSPKNPLSAVGVLFVKVVKQND